MFGAEQEHRYFPTSRARMFFTGRMCRSVANIRNRETTGDEVDSGRQHVDVSVCVSAHTHCGLVVLLQNGGDVIGLLLFLVCVVLD